MKIILFLFSLLSILPSPIAGILDIYYGEDLVNNIVVLAKWDEYYNNSEIQQSKITNVGGVYSYSPFTKEEFANPACNCQAELRLAKFGRTLIAHVSVDGATPGLGLFYGIHQRVGRVVIDGVSIFPEKLDYTTQNYTLGSFRVFDDVDLVVLDGEKYDIYIYAHEVRVDVETRNYPWLPEQTQTMDEWIESVIFYGEGDLILVIEIR